MAKNYWTKRSEERLLETEKNSEAYIKRVQAMYTRAKRNIQKEINNVYKNYASEVGVNVSELKKLLSKAETAKTWQDLQKQGLDKYIRNNYKSRITRLEQIKAQIYAKAKEIAPEETAITGSLYRNILKNGYYQNIYDVQQGLGIKFGFSQIDDKLVNALLSERWSGKNYSERIWGNTDILANTLSEELGGGLVSGASLEKIERKVRERFDVAKYYSQRLVRTEANHFHNQADLEAYKEMGVEEYVFVATLDNRTSEICQELDGKRFKVDDAQEGVNYPPMHPNCRSTTRAYVDEISESLMERRARDPETGKTEVVGNVTYKEWWEKYGNDNDTDANLKEFEKRGKNTDGEVNWSKIRDKSYKEKINKISHNEKLNDSIHDVSRKILSHRDNTLREDMYLLDYKTGKILASQTHMDKDEGISYNNNIYRQIKEKQRLKKKKKYIAIHNHPKSMPPSDSDFNYCFKNDYEFGIVIGHDGSIYKYSTKKMNIPIEKRFYDVAVDKHTRTNYNNIHRGQIDALYELSEKYGFKFEEVE